MNFARAWISRLISLAKTGLGIAPVPMKDRLQAAREANARLEATIHPRPDYRRRRLAHLPPERVRRYWENVEAVHAD
jgi:hypothetical protein